MLRSLLIGAKALFSKGRRSKEMDEELRGFLEAAAEDGMRKGMSHSEAMRAAQVEMGSMENVKELVRSSGWESMAEDLWRDLRYSARMMARSPGFTTVAVLSLALGIGANTAIFTLINNLMLKSLPVRNPQELVSFGREVGGGEVDGITPGPLDLFPYEFYKGLAPRNLFEGVCAYGSFGTPISVRLSTDASQSAGQARSHLVSGNFFRVLGAKPLLGRALTPDDDGQGGAGAAVVSYRYWQRDLLADTAVIGRTIAVNGTEFTIVGVMPAKFYGVDLNEDAPDMWLPLSRQPEVMLQPTLLGPHGLYWLHLMGRRAGGASLGQIQAWITLQTQHYIADREGPQLSAARRREIQRIYVGALPGNRGISDLRAQYAESLKILMGVVALVLLIACANLANLLLARAASREREISTRLALGSGRGRVMRQMLTEALLLSLCGGALGLILAYEGTLAMISFVAGGAGHTALAATPDVNVLLFTAGISLGTGLLFGLAPALRVSRLSVAPGAQANVRGAAGQSGRTGRLAPKLLVAFQVTLSLVLLAGAGLFVRTLHNLQSQEFGFNHSGVLMVTFDPKFAGYKPEQLNALHGRILDGLNAIPGVRSATMAGAPPISGGSWNSPIFIKGRSPQPNQDVSTLLARVGPRYFETMDMPILRGRAIGAHDTENGLKAAVVNQSLAAYFFPRGDAIGQSFSVADPGVKGDWQIVGIVRDAKYNSAREEPKRMAYLALEQLTGDDAYAFFLLLQTVGDPTRVTADVRRTMANIDPNVPIFDVTTVGEQVARRMANETLISRLSSFFSLLALLLAAIGLYGVMTYNVMRRANEIGIRMTLGAQPGEVLWMILRESLVLLGIGVAVGIPVTLAATRIVESQLFGLKASDPWTIGLAVLVISVVVLISAYFPARRATRVDPMVALRYQ